MTTTVTVVVQSLRSTSEIPRNWWRSVVSIDSHHPLEMLPGAYQRYACSIMDNFVEAAILPQQGVGALLVHRAPYGESLLARFVHYASLPFVSTVLVLPAPFYRWSLKGTALIYSPLIWIVHSATARPLRVYLQDIISLAYYRIG